MKERSVDKCVNHWNKVSSNMLKPVFFKEFYDKVEKIKDDTDMNFRADILMKVAGNSLRQNLTDRHKQIMCNLFKWTLNKIVYSFDKDVEESFLDLHWSDISTHSISTFNNLPLNAFAISFNNTVLPVFGGATISPRWPLPIGANISTMRVDMLQVEPLVKSNFSFGKRGTRCSNGMRSRTNSGVRPLIKSTLHNGKYFSPSLGGRIGPSTTSPVFSPFNFIWLCDT